MAEGAGIQPKPSLPACSPCHCLPVLASGGAEPPLGPWCVQNGARRAEHMTQPAGAGWGAGHVERRARATEDASVIDQAVTFGLERGLTSRRHLQRIS